MARERNASSRASYPVCEFTYDGQSCTARGDHYCELRADRVVAFFLEVLVHTKGTWARQPFRLRDWQEHDIIRPLFGSVIWSPDWNCYIRRYRVAWITLARKNGKSELAAGIVLYMLVGDDEQSSEVYGAAKDTKQARKVYDVVERMRSLSPILNLELGGRLGVNKNERRIFDLKTASYYEIITSDAMGELGHNPHAFVLDEVLSQSGSGLWNAMRTAMGTRSQPLMVALSTETNDPSSFFAVEADEMERVAEDPARAPHVFVYQRRTALEADPWDEKNWEHANPALGQFLSIQALRDEAIESKNDPTKENSFRQYRLNQRVQQTTRWMPLHLWDRCGGLVDEQQLKGHRCFGGLDLSSTSDLTALCWVFPDDQNAVLWRAWVPEEKIPFLDQHTGGQASVWARQGFLTATEGNVIDYDELYAQIDKDRGAFKVVDISYDRWMAQPIVQELEKRKLAVYPVGQGYLGISAAMKELMRLVKAKEINTGGNPVARWNADSIEVKRDDSDNIRPVKPDRDATGKRIDCMSALLDSIDGVMRRGGHKQRGRAVGF